MARPTMNDIAKRAGVSKNTVSLALRNDPQISPATRRKIEAIAEELNYQRNAVVGELMARLRSHQSPKYDSTLALINGNDDPHALQNHPTIPTYVEGCRRRAAQLGYGFNNFWMDDPELNARAFERVLRTRAIRGLLIVGMMRRKRFPAHLRPILENYPCVVTGSSTREPAMSYAAVDHHLLVLHAFEKALELGYRRPGMVLDRTIDDLVEGRFTAGYLTGQQGIPLKRRLKPFLQVIEARSNPALFNSWLDDEKPDVIFTLYNLVREWVERRGLRVPADIGMIQLEWRPGQPEWAGMHQHNDIVGEAAVDMLIGQIHRDERGVPLFPRATLVGASWVHGVTVQSAYPQSI